MFHFYKEKNGKIYFNLRRQKTMRQKFFGGFPLPISRVILLQVFYSWLQDSVLVPFSLCSVPLGHLVHVHNLNTLRTPNLPLADFPFEHQAFISNFLLSFSTSSYPPNIPLTGLKSIHHLSQQAYFNACIYSTINCVIVHSSFHLANVLKCCNGLNGATGKQSMGAVLWEFVS